MCWALSLLLKINRKLKCGYFRCFLPFDLLLLLFFFRDLRRRREPDEPDDEEDPELDDELEEELDELDERRGRLSPRSLGDSAG